MYASPTLKYFPITFISISMNVKNKLSLQELFITKEAMPYHLIGKISMVKVNDNG